MGGTLLERYVERIAGLLLCCERVVIAGPAPVKNTIQSLIDLRESALTASGTWIRFAARSCLAALPAT